MKKILMGLMSIVAVASVAGLGSFAFWSDTESASDNYFAAGSLNLLVNGIDLSEATQIKVENVYPGMTESMSGIVTNAGTIDGKLSLHVNEISNVENEVIEPETEDGDTTSEEGELCENVEITITYNETEMYHGALNNTTLETLALGTLAANETGNFSVSYLVPTNVDNTVMTDKCSFDVTLDLVQL